MRQITKDIRITIDRNLFGFRLTKLDAFSGVTLLRLLMRLEEHNTRPTMLDLILSDDFLYRNAVPIHFEYTFPGVQGVKLVHTALQSIIRK